MASGGTIDERYVWDGESLLAVLDSDDNVTERELNGPNVNQVFATEMVGGDNGGTNWLLADAQGSIRDVARATVSDSMVTAVVVVNHIIYDAYGNLPVPQSAAVPQYLTRVMFTGLLRDPATGMYKSVTRFYDPSTGTWISQDPLGLEPDTNPYRYCGDSPTNYVDPSGLGSLPLFGPPDSPRQTDRPDGPTPDNNAGNPVDPIIYSITKTKDRRDNITDKIKNSKDLDGDHGDDLDDALDEQRNDETNITKRQNRRFRKDRKVEEDDEGLEGNNDPYEFLPLLPLLLDPSPGLFPEPGLLPPAAGPTCGVPGLDDWMRPQIYVAPPLPPEPTPYQLTEPPTMELVFGFFTFVLALGPWCGAGIIAGRRAEAGTGTIACFN